MKSNLFLRVISALILAPIVLGAIIYGSLAYDILMAILGALMAWEWEKMIKGRETYVSVALATMATMVVFITKSDPELALLLVAACALFLYVKTGKQLLLSFGSFYIGLPLLCMMYIAYFTDSGEGDLNYSYMYVLWLLFVVWATDTGAYIFGRSIGGPKLAPRISPNKTWAGLLGGMFSAGIITYVFVLTVNHYFEGNLNPIVLITASIFLAFVSQMGDLFESRVKRYLNVKDSSNLIPGHGGVFDRVDGLLFAAPVVAVFVLLSNMGIFS